MRTALLVMLSLGALLLLAPVGSALAQVTVAAREAPQCPGNAQVIYCLSVIDGQIDGVHQGELVQLTFVNQGQVPHNAYVTTGAEADTATRDTPAEAAFANTSTLDGGQETNLSFIVPSDAEALYLWCDVGNHEALGMWLEVSVEVAQPGDNTTEGPGDGGMAGGDEADDRGQAPTEEPEGVPVPTWAPLVALLVALAVSGRL